VLAVHRLVDQNFGVRDLPKEADGLLPFAFRVDIAVVTMAEAENAAEDREWLEGGRADAIVVIGDLLQRIFQMERLAEAPDIGREQF